MYIYVHTCVCMCAFYRVYVCYTDVIWDGALCWSVIKPIMPACLPATLLIRMQYRSNVESSLSKWSHRKQSELDIYIYIYTYTYTYIYIYTYIQRPNTRVGLRLIHSCLTISETNSYVCIYVCMYLCMYYVCMYVCMYVYGQKAKVNLRLIH